MIMIRTPKLYSPTINLSPYMSIGIIADRLEVMQQKESTSYRWSDYIKDGAPSSSSVLRRRCHKEDWEAPDRDTITRDCRTKLGEWCFQVSDLCKFQRETVATAMSYLDRFMGTSSPRARRAMHDKKEFQLVAVTSIYVAVKLFETLAMNAAHLVEICCGCYTQEDIFEMEQEILKSLSWRLNGPSTRAYVNHVLALLELSTCGFDETVLMPLFDFSAFQADIAVLDYDLSTHNPSTLAVAAIMNSMEGIERRLFPVSSRIQFFSLVAEVVGVSPLSSQVNAARARLLELFSEHSGYELPHIAKVTPVTGSEVHPSFNRRELHDNPSQVSMSSSASKAKQCAQCAYK